MKRIFSPSLCMLALIVFPAIGQDSALSGIKTYLLDHVNQLQENAARLQQATQDYQSSVKA